MQLDGELRRLSLSPRSAKFVQDPYREYSALHATCPVFFWQEYGFWCFASHADVSALLRDRRFGRQILHVKSRSDLGWDEPAAHLAAFDAIEKHSLLELEPPDHTRLRGLVNRAFVSRRIEALRPHIATLANELIDRFAGQGRVELLSQFATPIPAIIIADLIGVPRSNIPALLDWSHKMVAMYQFGRDRSVEDTANTASRSFRGYLGELIAERRKAPADDLITALISVEEQTDQLSEDEMITTLILLLNAGHEASVHAIANAVKALLEHRISYDDAFASDAATQATVEETLRFDAPLHLFTRYALVDLDYRGIALRAGDKVGLLLGAANRDPSRFAAPDRLDLQRSDAAQHVSFGGGIHFCLGAPLARLEMHVALPILFQRLPALKLAAAPHYRDTYHFHGLERLDLEF